MLQEINLYPLLSKKSRFHLTPKKMILAYSSFLLILLIFHFVELRQKHNLMLELEKLNIEVSLEQQELNMLMQKYPVIDPAILKESINQLQKDYDIKTKSIDLLSPYAHFSSYLIGLGHAIIPGVWLTQITFDRGENKISLKGFALQPTLLEKFYRELVRRPAFINLEFKVNEVKQTTIPASFYITARKVNKI